MYDFGTNQTGYIKGRFIGENIRCILDTIDYCKSTFTKGMLLLIDFEKAFDTLNWNFIFHCLHMFGFKDNFCTWVRTLYSNSSARYAIMGIFPSLSIFKEASNKAAP